MKRKFVMLMMPFMFAGFSLYSQSDILPNEVLKSFQKNFSGIEAKSWVHLENEQIYKASFHYAESYMEAYFSEDGQVLMKYREVRDFKNIPIWVLKKFKEEYGSYFLVNCYETVTGNEVKYFFKVRDEKMQLTLEISPDGTKYVIAKDKIK